MTRMEERMIAHAEAQRRGAGWRIEMRYRLRTLLIALALGPPLMAGAFFLLPLVPLRVRQFEMTMGFYVWLGVLTSAIALSLRTRRRPSNSN